MTNCDILGLGCVAVDDLLVVPSYPAPETKLRLRRRERQCGGVARAAGIPVVADLERDEWPGFPELLALVDHLIVCQAFAEKRTGATEPAAAVDRLWRNDRRAVVVTCGAAGCWYRGDDQARPRH